MKTNIPRYFAIVPAAGGGSRMGATRPKQYLDLLGKPLIWHTLQALLSVSKLTGVYVVLAPDDSWWGQFDWSDLVAPVHCLPCGGETRAHSVRNALAALPAKPDDWVLVHDAARVCLQASEVEGLIDTLQDDAVGGLLACPLADTLKRADSTGRVQQTVAREALWQAQTPQMFRHGLLQRALLRHAAVTDEAGAIEALNLAPRLVAAPASNFKVTYAQDLLLAEQILRSRESGV